MQSNDKTWTNPKTGISFRVDHELKDDWLLRLNLLKFLSLQSICAGHLEAAECGSSKQEPTIRLDVLTDIYPVKPCALRRWASKIRRLLASNPSYVKADWTDVQPRTFHIILKSKKKRTSCEMEDYVDEWFEETVSWLEKLDPMIGDIH